MNNNLTVLSIFKKNKKKTKNKQKALLFV